MKEIETVIFMLAVICVLSIMAGVLVWHIFAADDGDDAIFDELAELRADNQALIIEKAEIEQAYNDLTEKSDALKEMITSMNEENRELFAQLQKARNSISNRVLSGTLEQKSTDKYERLPANIATNRYDCMGDKFPDGTQQAKLQAECKTDPETGIKYWTDGAGNRYYCAAMGAAYGIDIGRCFIVTLECGYSFGVILAEYQHDITAADPDDFGEMYYRDRNGEILPDHPLVNYDDQPVCHVLEFVCDMRAVSYEVRRAGGMHALAKFGGKYGTGGNIVKIQHRGRLWEP